MPDQSEDLLDLTIEKLDEETIRVWSQHFRRFGITKVTALIPPAVRATVLQEAEALLNRFGERRDLRLATTDFTRRSMTVVPSEKIAKHGHLIRHLYSEPQLIDTLEAIAREKLQPCPKADEEFLISRHERQGDTHGWHWGDFSFALIWVLKAPELEAGGLLQCVPHTDWDKSKPRILKYLTENPVNTYYFESGDVYFLRTDTTLHRTIPLNRDVIRIMLNMTFASPKDLHRNLTADDRWWEDASVSAAVPTDEVVPTTTAGSPVTDERGRP